MGKHNLGIFYFKKALQENDNACAQLGMGNSEPGKAFKRLKAEGGRGEGESRKQMIGAFSNYQQNSCFISL